MEYLGKIEKYGAVDITEGVLIDRTVQRSPIVATVDSAVKSDMNGDCLNINIQLASASKIRDDGLDEQVVDEIEVMNENSGFSASNSAATFATNFKLQSINIRDVDEIMGTGSEGIQRIPQNGIKPMKRKEMKKKLDD